MQPIGVVCEALGFAALCAFPVQGQDYPGRAVRIIVPVVEEGSPVMLGRLIG